MVTDSQHLPDLEKSPVWHPYTSIPARGPRALIPRARGAYVYDESGRAIFDATSSWWCIVHGHCHPRLAQALARQADTLDQVLLSPHSHPLAQELAERLLAKLGAPFEKVFFSDDGSTAVEAALKMALQYWQLKGQTRRTHFLSVELGYHGDTLGAISVGQISQFHQYFNHLRTPVFKSTEPYCYRCPLGKQYPSCGIACLDAAARTIAERGDEIAALIVEPLILGAAGMISYPKEYLERLVALARARGILVIFDEVFTGFGRTGTFFAMEQVAQKPDLVCMSKGLTAGMMAMGATAATGEIFRTFVGGPERTLYHGHTFTANALACAVAVESLKIFDDENVISRNARLAAVMAAEAERFRALPHVGEVRHLGMIWALELVRDRATKDAFDPPNGPGWSVADALWRQGYWIRPLHGVVYVVPPYCASESDLQGFFKVLYSELSDERHYR